MDSNTNNNNNNNIDDDVASRLADITQQAVILDERLAALCQSQSLNLPALLASTDAATRPLIAKLASHTKDMHSVIADTALMADRISRKVRLLDRDQQQVRSVLALIDDLSEIRDSAAEVQTAMAAQDWELAAIHIQRFLKHDIQRIQSVYNKYKPVSYTQPSLSINTQKQLDQNESEIDPFLSEAQNQISKADLYCPPGSPDPIETLSTAKANLIQVICTEFDKAVESGDEAAIVRFFKLFAVVGERAAGLDRFANVLAGVVKRLGQDYMRAVSEADRVPTLYADLMTRLFEAVASLIDKQEMIVERHYGPGRLLRVIVRLQKEVDVQTSIVLDSFEDKRMISRKIADINALEIAASQNKPPPPTAALLDPREVDALVNEIAIMSQRTRLFSRFLEVRSNAEEEKLTTLEDSTDSTPTTKLAPANPSKPTTHTRPSELDNIALNKQSTLTRRIKEIMSNFSTLQEFFLKKSIEKALKLDLHEPGSLTSSSVDDVFYITKTSVTRTFLTSDPLTICSVLESVGRILETEYVAVFLKRLGGGNMGTLETKEGKVGVLVILNNLDTSCDYITKLVKEINGEIDRSFGQTSPAAELERLRTCLGSLTDYGSSFKRSLMVWVENIFNQMIKPKIRPTMADVCKDVKYVLSDEEYTEADSQDVFFKRFVREFGKIIALFKSTYSPRNHNQNVSYFIDAILAEWERHMFANVKFNALGALRFDKDLRSVTSYLTSLTTWSIRDKFVRLNNASALLNVEGLGEVAEVMGVSAGWRLSVADAKRVLALRVDFNAADIAQLRLQ